MLLTALLQQQKHGLLLSTLKNCRLIPQPLRQTWLSPPLNRTYQSQSQSRTQGQTQAAASPERFRILFMGRDEFSCLVFKQLYQAKDVWNEIVIATLPDVHVGRGGSVLSISPLKTLGEKLDIPVWTIPKAKKEFKTWELPPPFAIQTSLLTPEDSPPPPGPPPTHLLITASFGRILSPKMLHSFQAGRRLNVHPSLLPAYRGPAPIQHTIMNGEKETGVCVIEMLRMKEGIDAGGIWGQESMAVPEDATFEQLRDELAVLGGKLLVNVLRDAMRDKAVSAPQPSLTADDGNGGVDVPKAPFISAKDALVDFRTMTAEDVNRRFRAIHHQKPLYTYSPDGKPLQLSALAPIDPEDLRNPTKKHVTEKTFVPFLMKRLDLATNTDMVPKLPGSTSFYKREKILLVRCQDGSLLGVRKVKPEGKGVMEAEGWWNGLSKVKSGLGGVVLGVEGRGRGRGRGREEEMKEEMKGEKRRKGEGRGEK